MSDRSKVIWSEGLFLRPQHFQQQERYLEWYVEGRTTSRGPHAWGFEELELNTDFLAQGKLAIRRARGVFPDGTPFSIADHDPAPPPLAIPPDTRNKRLYLGLPLRRAGALETDRREGADGLARQGIRELELRDVTVESATTALIEVGGLRTRMLIEQSPTGDFACIPLAHVLECRAGGQVVLDERFMPTVTRLKACPPLSDFVSQLYGMLHQRGDELAKVVTSEAQGGLSAIREFLRLQTINRHEPLVRHFMQSAAIHPEQLFMELLVLAGELAGTCRGSQRPALFSAYEHGDLRVCFELVMDTVRTYLIDEGIRPVLSINVELKQSDPTGWSSHLAVIADSTLIESAVFILAVKAALPQDEIRRRAPQVLTVAPSGSLQKLVELATPGLELVPLVQHPPLIPYFAGYVYFEINRSNRLWKEMRGSGAFGLFAAEALPNLNLLMWAVRGV